MNHRSRRRVFWDMNIPALGVGTVWVFILAYILFFGALTLHKHDAFQSTAFDLGNVDQAVWNTLHGRPFAMTNIEGLTNRLGTHVEPILPFLSLVYVVWSDPRALLLLQTTVIALGAWPVYLLAKRASSPRAQGLAGDGPSPASISILALSFALAYLLFPALQSANLCDFHALAMAPTFFLLALYCLETERWGGLALFSVLTASCKEEMALLVAMLGLYALLVRRRWRVGLAMVIASGAWFAVATGWILPRFDAEGASPLASRYGHLGDNALQIAFSPITRPGVLAEYLFTSENLAYMRDLLAPAAFLSLLAPQLLILLAPSLAVNLLSSESFMHELEGVYYYGAPLVPVVVVSAAYGAAWLLRRLPRARALPLLLAAIVLASSLLYHRSHGFTPLAAEFRRYSYTVDDHDRLGLAMAKRIPTEASLATSARLNPHASQRQELYAIDLVENGLPAFPHKTDYMWLDVTNGWPLQPADLQAVVGNLLARGYGIEEAGDGWILLRLGAENKTWPSSFYSFARVPNADPRLPVRIQLSLEGEPALECVGLDWSWHREGIEITFYWRALRPLPPGLRLVPLSVSGLAGADGDQTTTLQPLVSPMWYPPERWQVGEMVATSTLVWPVDSGLTVGLGAMLGDDWQDRSRRLTIQAVPPASSDRLLDGDTWACVLQIVDAGDAQPCNGSLTREASAQPQ